MKIRHGFDVYTMATLLLLGLLSGRALAESSERPKLDPSRSLRVLRPNKLPGMLPARRIDIGAGYKPTMARLPDGELVMTAFFWKKDKGYHEFSKIWRSTDNGKSWSNPVRVTLRTGQDLIGRENWLTAIDDGSPRGLLFSTNHILSVDLQNPTPGTTRSSINRSTDGGRTWIQTVLPTKWSHTSRNIIKMPDGSLRVGANNLTGGNNRWLTSTDAGATWTESKLKLPYYTNYRGKRAAYDNHVGFFQESFTYVNSASELLQWIRLDRGSSMFAMHDKKPTGNDNVDRMIFTKSTDGGITWSDIVDCPGYSGNNEPYGQMYPRAIQLKDGRMLLTYTNRSGIAPLGLRAVLSSNGGQTFDFKNDVLILDEITKKGWSSGGGFGNSIQLPDGRLISCYSYATSQLGSQHPHIEVIHWRLP